MKTLNIFDFFPLRNNEMVERYLRDDEDLPERKRQYFSVVLKAVTDSKKSFANAIIRETFSLDYVINHRWPTIW